MSNGKSRGAGFWIAIVAGVVLSGLCCLGIVGAVAVPAFIQYTRKSKTAEANANVRAIFAGVVTSASGMQMVSGKPVPGGLGTSLPRTPAVVPCGERVAWPVDAHPGWSLMGFAPAEPVYYAYEYVVGADGASFVVRATGDLDCDGTLSVFELQGVRAPDGTISRVGEIAATNETE